MFDYKSYKHNISIVESMDCKEFIDFMDSKDFENFKSNICHTLKALGDLAFLVVVLKKNIIRYCYEENLLIECFYLLGLVDYLCRINGLPFDKEYEDIREYELEERVFPGGINILCSIENSDNAKQEALNNAIPEFLRFNIVEWGIRNAA